MNRKSTDKSNEILRKRLNNERESPQSESPIKPSPGADKNSAIVVD